MMLQDKAEQYKRNYIMVLLEMEKELEKQKKSI
jgi:hypothetical protein